MKGEFQKVLDYQLDKGKAEGRAEERLNSSKYFKEQMEQLGINKDKINEIMKDFENMK